MHTTSYLNTRFKPLAYSILILASLGCFLGDVGLLDDEPRVDAAAEQDRIDEIEGPTYNPSHHNARDDPDADSFRGSFTLSIKGELDLTLDAQKLGEATFALIPQDGVDSKPHCRITLADRTPNATGTQGYLILQYFGDHCPEPGSYPLLEPKNASSHQPFMTLRSIQIDRETDELSVAITYFDATGEVHIQRQDGDRMYGNVSIQTQRKYRDNGTETIADLSVDGSFTAIKHQP